LFITNLQLAISAAVLMKMLLLLFLQLLFTSDANADASCVSGGHSKASKGLSLLQKGM